jgi:hypothetical protein
VVGRSVLLFSIFLLYPHLPFPRHRFLCRVLAHSLSISSHRNHLKVTNQSQSPLLPSSNIWTRKRDIKTDHKTDNCECVCGKVHELIHYRIWQVPHLNSDALKSQTEQMITQIAIAWVRYIEKHGTQTKSWETMNADLLTKISTIFAACRAKYWWRNFPKNEGEVITDKKVNSIQAVTMNLGKRIRIQARE